MTIPVSGHSCAPIPVDHTYAGMDMPCTGSHTHASTDIHFETQHHPLIRELTLSKRIHAVSLCDVRTRYTHMGTPPQLTTTWSTGLSQASSGMLCAPFGHTRCGGKGLTAGSSGGVVLLTLVDAHTRLCQHTRLSLTADTVVEVVLRRATIVKLVRVRAGASSVPPLI